MIDPELPTSIERHSHLASVAINGQDVRSTGTQSPLRHPYHSTVFLEHFKLGSSRSTSSCLPLKRLKKQYFDTGWGALFHR